MSRKATLPAFLFRASCLARAYAGCLLLVMAFSLPVWSPPSGAVVSAAEKGGKEFPKKRFLRALTLRGERSRHGALNEIESKFPFEPAAAEVLIQALEETDPNEKPRATTLRIIRLLGQFDDPRATDGLVSALASSDLRTVMCTIDVLGQRRDKKAVGAIIRLQERDEFASTYGFRKCLLHAVMQISRPEAVDFCMAQLRTTDRSLRRDIVHYLSKISGQRNGQDTAAWTRWWNNERQRCRFAGIPRWSPPTARELAYVLQDASLSRYYSFDIYANNVVFIIDRSGSMRRAAARGTRLDEGKAELIGAISRLPETARFNIICYDGRAKVWQKGGLVPTTDINKQRAGRFISRMRPGSGTASYDALAAALELDGATEELFFVSDGKPTAGKVINPADIIRTITEKNFLHRVSINTVAIDAQGDAAKFMSVLAQQNNGSFKGAVH